ncbi:MAG: hypothetical protein PHG48_03940 [Eubacteriales bacterium]|nr:hypothetical protein [Eubacteriales bacterium]
MLNKKLYKAVVIFILAIFLITSILSFTGRAFGQPGNIAGEIDKIGIEEQSVLEELFRTLQEIDALKAEEDRLASDIAILKDGTVRLAEKIAANTENYKAKLDIFAEILRAYQTGGPGYYFSILMKAGDLSSFLKGIGLLKDLSRRTNELLNDLKKESAELNTQKQALEQDSTILENKMIKLQESIAAGADLKNRLETQLASLKEEKDFFEARLEELGREWDILKKAFPTMVDVFAEEAENGGITMDELGLRFEFPYFKGSAYESTFNRITEKHPSIPQIIFDFTGGKAIISVPEHRLILEGTFVVEGRSTISYVAQKGTFYDMPLESASIRELFSGGSLRINFDEYIEGVSINSVAIREGYVEFSIIASLW